MRGTSSPPPPRPRADGPAPRQTIPRQSLCFVDLFFLDGPITDLFWSISPSIFSILVSLPFRKLEQQVQELPCATEELRQEWVAIRQE